jgi:hypothetical protein
VCVMEVRSIAFSCQAQPALNVRPSEFHPSIGKKCPLSGTETRESRAVLGFFEALTGHRCEDQLTGHKNDEPLVGFTANPPVMAGDEDASHSRPTDCTTRTFECHRNSCEVSLL